MNDLSYWVYRILLCRTIEEMREALRKFDEGIWSIEDRSVISATYTPRLIDFMGKGIAEEDRKFLLEEFASLCWGCAA